MAIDVDNISNINRLSSLNRIGPITTGLPSVTPQSEVPQRDQNQKSFGEILRQQLNETSGLNFSKHAVNRISERNVDVDNQMQKLRAGFEIAEQKGLRDALIMVDSTAYIVNVTNNTVVTTVNDLKGNAFTNIDGAVFL